MIRRLLSIASVLVLATFWANVVHANDTESEIKAVMTGYEKAWSQHDAKAIANYYHEPAMRVSKTGPTVRPTSKSQEIFLRVFLVV